MTYKNRRDCPYPGCGKTSLMRLSDHLRQYHSLDSGNRKKWLRRGRLSHPQRGGITTRAQSEREARSRSPLPREQKGTFQFRHPFTCIVAGPSQSGKTTWLVQLLRYRNQLFDKPPERIVYCYKRYQSQFDEMKRWAPQMEFVQGIPPDLDSDSFIDSRARNLLILDDLMRPAGKNDAIDELFTEGSHQRNLSVFLLVQNFYHKNTVEMRKNALYIVLFEMPGDQKAVRDEAGKMFPDDPSYMVKKYQEATANKYGYLVLDKRTGLSLRDKLHTDIFPTAEKSGVAPRVDLRAALPFPHVTDPSQAIAQVPVPETAAETTVKAPKQKKPPPTPPPSPPLDDDDEDMDEYPLDNMQEGLRMCHWLYNPHQKDKEPSHWKDLVRLASYNSAVDREKIANDKALVHLCLAECQDQSVNRGTCSFCSGPHVSHYYLFQCPHCSRGTFCATGKALSKERSKDLSRDLSKEPNFCQCAGCYKIFVGDPKQATRHIACCTDCDKASVDEVGRRGQFHHRNDVKIYPTKFI